MMRMRLDLVVSAAALLAITQLAVRSHIIIDRVRVPAQAAAAAAATATETAMMTTMHRAAEAEAAEAAEAAAAFLRRVAAFLRSNSL